MSSKVQLSAPPLHSTVVGAQSDTQSTPALEPWIRWWHHSQTNNPRKDSPPPHSCLQLYWTPPGPWSAQLSREVARFKAAGYCDVTTLDEAITTPTPTPSSSSRPIVVHFLIDDAGSNQPENQAALQIWSRSHLFLLHTHVRLIVCHFILAQLPEKDPVAHNLSTRFFLPLATLEAFTLFLRTSGSKHPTLLVTNSAVVVHVFSIPSSQNLFHALRTHETHKQVRTTILPRAEKKADALGTQFDWGIVLQVLCTTHHPALPVLPNQPPSIVLSVPSADLESEQRRRTHIHSSVHIDVQRWVTKSPERSSLDWLLMDWQPITQVYQVFAWLVVQMVACDPSSMDALVTWLTWFQKLWMSSQPPCALAKELPRLMKEEAALMMTTTTTTTMKSAPLNTLHSVRSARRQAQAANAQHAAVQSRVLRWCDWVNRQLFPAIQSYMCDARPDGSDLFTRLLRPTGPLCSALAVQKQVTITLEQYLWSLPAQDDHKLSACAALGICAHCSSTEDSMLLLCIPHCQPDEYAKRFSAADPFAVAEHAPESVFRLSEASLQCADCWMVLHMTGQSTPPTVYLPLTLFASFPESRQAFLRSLFAALQPTNGSNLTDPNTVLLLFAATLLSQLSLEEPTLPKPVLQFLVVECLQALVFRPHVLFRKAHDDQPRGYRSLKATIRDALTRCVGFPTLWLQRFLIADKLVSGRVTTQAEWDDCHAQAHRWWCVEAYLCLENTSHVWNNATKIATSETSRRIHAWRKAEAYLAKPSHALPRPRLQAIRWVVLGYLAD